MNHSRNTERDDRGQSRVGQALFSADDDPVAIDAGLLFHASC